MSIQTKTIEYHDGDQTLEALMAWDDSQSSPRPGVVIAHAWGGRDEFVAEKAKKLAELGYVGFALDMYGKGQRGNTTEECSALMTPFMQDRVKLQSRMQLGLAIAKAQPEIDAAKVAAMGFCFGGLCVLDLARSGADLAGVASFHGLLQPPGNTVDQIKAKVLIMHGYADPMAQPEALLAIHQELTEAKADWQSISYGHTLHAFTNPQANDPGFGTVYSAAADARSWYALQGFLAELFA